MLTKETIIKRINKNRKTLKSFGVKKLTLIGSYARGKATAKSDIDFLVSFEKKRGLFDDYVHLRQYLQGLFKLDIDIGEPHLLREELKDSILGGPKVEAAI